jgi:hypothetical protein
LHFLLESHWPLLLIVIGLVDSGRQNTSVVIIKQGCDV